MQSFTRRLMTINITKTAVDKLVAPTIGNQSRHYDNQLKGFGVRITSKGVKAFFLETTIGGKRKRLTLGRYPSLSVEMARKEAQKFLGKLAIKKNKQRLSVLTKNKGKDGSKESTKVYVMIDKNTGYYKIGRSKNPKIREKTLQSEKPTIEMLFNHDAKTVDEKVLHSKFSEKRVRGEWFDLCGSDLSMISDYFNKQNKQESFTNI